MVFKSIHDLEETVSHLRLKFALVKALFSKSRIMLNTKNESERPVQSETNIVLIFNYDTQGNKIREDRVGNTTKNKTKRP